ncbi:helix-turn-helix transcriptional regulator [Streptomyces sp. NBC_01190]|uniref:helix-turn-helix transcriptional regulator n=1 Tax=Streptomyces sp. NBC_01190 TaxID=2903767 RepID=UPI0038653522|nr:helix-turn-helix domain-containing protein [Streptomyces sp. NBC_01190]
MSLSNAPLPARQRTRESGAVPDEYPPGHAPTEMLTTQEIARLLRVDPSSVRRWRSQQPPQGPPFVRLSQRKVLYDATDLQHWLEQRRTDTEQVAA